MFRDEARTIAQLNHGNIAQFLEFGRYGENFYIAMEYVSGKSLKELLNRYKTLATHMPAPFAVYVVVKICAGLGYAHRKTDLQGNEMHIIHRDVSPANILISYEGEVKLVDFGIAKAANRKHTTCSGFLRGKFEYMSPEQVRSLPLDPRSDVFACGVVLFETLTGKKPFEGESDFDTLKKVVEAQVPSTRQLNPEIPIRLEEIVQKALARDVESRYISCSDLHDDLMRFLLDRGRGFSAPDAAQMLRQLFPQDFTHEQMRLEGLLKTQVCDDLAIGTRPTIRDQRATKDHIEASEARNTILHSKDVATSRPLGSRRKHVPTMGNFSLLERLAVGELAEVFLARTSTCDDYFVVKRLMPIFSDDPKFLQAFIDEARTSKLFSHANIVRTFEVGHDGDNYYIVTEYVPGKDLRSLLLVLQQQRLILPTVIATHIIQQVCAGLHYAHNRIDEQGKEMRIIHRDVSPSNILISYEGNVKIVDFGIAKAANQVSRTQSGFLKGKFAYMSPEQVRGLTLDRRSDIFACGTVLYEMLAGIRPFDDESNFDILEKVRDAQPIPPRNHNPRIPEALQRIVLKALARIPEERYQWCSEMETALAHVPVVSTDIPPAEQLSQLLKSTFALDFSREQTRHTDHP